MFGGVPMYVNAHLSDGEIWIYPLVNEQNGVYLFTEHDGDGFVTLGQPLDRTTTELDVEREFIPFTDLDPIANGITELEELPEIYIEW